MAMRTSSDPELIRLLTTVAWLYHERGLGQSAIATRLGISQSRVSRLLDQAGDIGIIRTVVVPPETVSSPLDTELQSAFGMRGAHVYELGDIGDETDLAVELGQLLALHLPPVLATARTVGLTSWSRSLNAAVGSLKPTRESAAEHVVEMLGDLGPPLLQHQAAGVTQRLAATLDARPEFLRIPGVSVSPEVRATLLAYDQHAQDVLRLLDDVDVALVGVGSGQVVPPLKTGDNFFTAEQIDYARRCGAVGEVNLHFIDADGRPVATDLDDYMVGASLPQLLKARHRIGVAGGVAKHRAIRAALRGGLIDTLVTDGVTARYLIDHP